MRTFMGLLFLTLLFANLAAAQGKDSALEPGARKASDEVMADLVANRTSGAIEKVAPMKIAALEGFRTQLRQMLERCGRPLDSKIQHGGKPILGEDVLPDGTKTTWNYQYLCKTTREPIEFWVTVESIEKGKYKVAFTCNPHLVSLPTSSK
jgi:hypothetical protein